MKLIILTSLMLVHILLGNPGSCHSTLVTLVPHQDNMWYHNTKTARDQAK